VGTAGTLGKGIRLNPAKDLAFVAAPGDAVVVVAPSP
jgi:hypothetical protein